MVINNKMSLKIMITINLYGTDFLIPIQVLGPILESIFFIYQYLNEVIKQLQIILKLTF